MNQPVFDATIMHIRSASFESARFEYHSQSKELYYIPKTKAGGLEKGFIILGGIPDATTAKAMVSVFIVGFRYAKAA